MIFIVNCEEVVMHSRVMSHCERVESCHVVNEMGHCERVESCHVVNEMGHVTLRNCHMKL